ncbi:MAG: hypothetical protein ACTHJR_12550, partial [Sphingomonas sp.]|uniref:hypothetical protein n=1 Tax=Sphingomonas sp. TaxID=28214 RepID=UPI003F81FA4B
APGCVAEWSEGAGLPLAGGGVVCPGAHAAKPTVPLRTLASVDALPSALVAIRAIFSIVIFLPFIIRALYSLSKDLEPMRIFGSALSLRQGRADMRRAT